MKRLLFLFVFAYGLLITACGGSSSATNSPVVVSAPTPVQPLIFDLSGSSSPSQAAPTPANQAAPSFVLPVDGKAAVSEPTATPVTYAYRETFPPPYCDGDEKTGAAVYEYEIKSNSLIKRSGYEIMKEFYGDPLHTDEFVRGYIYSSYETVDCSRVTIVYIMRRPDMLRLSVQPPVGISFRGFKFTGEFLWTEKCMPEFNESAGQITGKSVCGK